MLKSLTALLIACLTLQAIAQTYKIDAKPDKADGLYQPGEPIIFSVRILKDDTVNPPPRTKLDFKPVAGVKLKYVISADGDFYQTGSLVSAQDYVALPPTKLNYPGWIRVRFTLLDQNNQKIKQIDNSSHGAGAMIQPEKLTYFGKEPADFDAFWQKQRELLNQVPINAKLTPVKHRREESFKLYDFQLDCAGGMPVRGYLSIPVYAKPKSLPIIVGFHGAGVRSAYQATRHGAISIDVNAHGILNGQPAEYYDELRKGKLRNYLHANKDNRETCFLLPMFLRVMRTLDYAKTLPEWNGKDLIVHGGSQGGTQALVAGALDKQVTIISAKYPGFADHAASLAKPHRRTPGGPKWYFAERDGSLTPQNLKIAQAAEYYDCVNFARRIHCETYLSAGFADLVCSPTSIYLIYNSLPKNVKKHIHVAPSAGHNAPLPASKQRVDQIIKQTIKALKTMKDN